MDNLIPFDRMFEGTRLSGYCASVYDGDTIKVGVPLPNSTDDRKYLVNCRLSGIDTAEMRGTRGATKQKAIAARDRLRGWLLEKGCEIQCGRLDKYGRLLVEVFALDDETTSCNQRLLDEGLALPYDGGTKTQH